MWWDGWVVGGTGEALMKEDQGVSIVMTSREQRFCVVIHELGWREKTLSEVYQSSASHDDFIFICVCVCVQFFCTGIESCKSLKYKSTLKRNWVVNFKTGLSKFYEKHSVKTRASLKTQIASNFGLHSNFHKNISLNWK